MAGMDDSEPGALGVVRKVLSFEMTIAEWIGTAAILAAPYLVIGVIWALTHTSDLAAAYGIRWLLLLVRSIIFWPVILLSNVCF